MLSVVLFIFVAVVLVALMFGGSWGKSAREDGERNRGYWR